ncbi:MAG: purine-binding chemotaxis protein CheW [Candidatus Eisenbacteria bacterium]|nr:purine-binding chemotaxis protein CheW [Candidatus Eisenbacteria bacterium]MCC7141514.1 purine-binding chemotaxis protein CheW [Candidatus Eisenbacteria bacterium]
MTEQISGQAVGGEQFLTFTIGAEEYGIEILKVQEIKGYSAITPIPNAPHYVRGVINLRGTIVPVVDLRARFGMSEEAYTKFTVIIVVNLGRRVVGLVVDAVSDVLNVGEQDVEPPPPLGVGVDTGFMTGLAKMGERLVLLLNIEQVANLEESVLQTA